MSAFFSKVKSFFSSIFTAVSPIIAKIIAFLPSLSSTALVLLGVVAGYILHPFIKLAVDIVRLLLKI